LLVGGAPILLLVLTGAGIIQVLLIFLVTLRWKISGHSAAVAGVAVLALMLFGKVAVFFALTVPLVAWSRIRLGRHSLYQTVAGALLGGLIIAVALLLYQKWIMMPEL
jgi:membrane-associated phospholipid phosphatase